MYVCAKEQKFMVLTWSMWRTHGCFLASDGVSTGRTTLMEDSSSAEIFHTMSLLSLPWLGNKVRYDIAVGWIWFGRSGKVASKGWLRRLKVEVHEEPRGEAEEATTKTANSCLEQKDIEPEKQEGCCSQRSHSRDDFVLSPSSCTQNSPLMSLPYRNGSLGRKTPHNDPTIRVARQKSTIRSYELGWMDLSGMAPENVGWLGRW